MKFLLRIFYLDSFTKSDISIIVKITTGILAFFWGFIGTVLGLILPFFPLVNPITVVGWIALTIFMFIRAREISNDNEED